MMFGFLNFGGKVAESSDTVEGFIRFNSCPSSLAPKGYKGYVMPISKVDELLKRYFNYAMTPPYTKPSKEPEPVTDSKPAAKNRVVAIHHSDFLKYGCPNCGCDVVLSGSGLAGIGHCEECGQRQMFVEDQVNGVIDNISFQDQEDGTFYHPVIEEHHPREGIPWHPYVWPDPRPEGGGEYWETRGIGYDLSGFVKSKEAGLRIYEMVKEVLGRDSFKSWLDYRPNEPKWIQFKFSPEEFDLEKLHFCTLDNHRIVTKEILEQCKLAEKE